MRTIVCAIAIAATLPAQPPSQGQPDVIGSWRLVSASASTADGGTNPAPYGDKPTGILTYSPDGRMSAMISNGGRKPLSADRIAAPAAERAEAFATFFGYAGRYSFNGDRIVHHVEIASVPNWVNTDLVRVVTVQGDRITLRTPPLSVGGTSQMTELIWERIK